MRSVRRRLTRALSFGKARGDLENFAVRPQGVRGYRIALVRPPWGWSLGFLAVPLTKGRRPNRLDCPALTNVKYFKLAG